MSFLSSNNYDEENVFVAEQLYDLLNNRFSQDSINSYALQVMTHITDRKQVYLESKSTFKKIVS